MHKNKKFNSKNIIRNIIDPWAGYKHITGIKESKSSLLKNYSKINNLPLPPVISFKKKSEVIAIGVSTFLKLPLELQKKTHVVFRPTDLIRNAKTSLGLISNSTLDLKIYNNVYKSIKNRSNNNFSYIEKILKQITPKILVISSTIDPVQRLWVYWANKLSIKIICFQHGIFSSLSSPLVLERNIVDFYFALCKEQSNVIQKIIPKKKHFYLFSKSKFKFSFLKSKKINICLIGTDHERYGKKGKKNKKEVLKIYRELINILNSKNKTNFNFFYKKHPSEYWSSNIDQIASMIDSKNIDKIDVFFGVASTKLLNISFNRQCAIQISSKNFMQDNYEKYGFCKTIDLNYIKKNGFNLFDNKQVYLPCLKRNNISKILFKILNSKIKKNKKNFH